MFLMRVIFASHCFDFYMDTKTEKQILQLLQGLKTDVGVLKTDVGMLKTDVGMLKTDVGMLKTDVIDLKGDVKVLTKIAHSTAIKVSEHELALTQFLTKDEFAIFRNENAGAHDRTAKTLERLEQEFKAFNRAHSRLEDRVDCHEKVLVKHRLMDAAAA